MFKRRAERQEPTEPNFGFHDDSANFANMLCNETQCLSRDTAQIKWTNGLHLQLKGRPRHCFNVLLCVLQYVIVKKANLSFYT